MTRETVEAAGRAYADGRLSVDEVAVALGVDVPDALVELEAHGFARGIDKIRLSDEERAAKLKLIRQDRLARNGKPVYDPVLATRCAVASLRIEGIDARWLLKPV